MIRKLKSLTPELTRVIKDKGTEAPFSYQEQDGLKQGSYICRGCGAALFRSENKFNSGCGWPSFDDDIPNAIKRDADTDGRRTEIMCAHCGAHLGHVFMGEKFTQKNLRHCVNGCAIEFVVDKTVSQTDEVIVAGGCFWGVEHLFKQLPGVLLTEVGYIGGTADHPTYEQVCSHATGHVEAVRVLFDLKKISYETILKYFFEIHDPTQQNGQGPDIGSQYLSQIFYFDDAQKKIADGVMNELKMKGFSLSTQLKPIEIFWPAEKYHQDYYEKNQKAPYCHRYTKRF